MSATITLLDAVAETTSLQSSEPTDWCSTENWHEAANIFPLMPEDELQKLADDIKQHGQRNPIILLNNKVLDGRNRVLACKLAGVRPDFQPRNPDKLGSPTAWVLSQNLHRRQLTATQRAFIAVEAEKLFAKEIAEKERIRKAQSTEEKIPQSPDERAPQARDKAAAACDVNARYVQDAKKISAMSPDTAEAAKAGGISMAEAKRLSSPPSEPTVEPEEPILLRIRRELTPLLPTGHDGQLKLAELLEEAVADSNVGEDPENLENAIWLLEEIARHFTMCAAELKSKRRVSEAA